MSKLQGTISGICLWFVLCAGNLSGVTAGKPVIDGTELRVTASFAGKESIAATGPFELQLSRPLTAEEGRLAVLVGQTDVTALMTIGTQTLHFESRAFPLPAGETQVTVYLVAADNEWKEIATFPLRVAATEAPVIGEAPAQPPVTETNGVAAAADPAAAATPPVKRRFGFDKIELAPSLNLGVKSQFAETHFPDANRPARTTFADATLTGTWKSEMARGAMQMQQQFDIVGSSFRNEALRFNELQNGAPKIDLSSYLMQFQQGTRKLNLGHGSFGAHRHLINNFSSRGMTFTTPLNSRIDLSAVAMNSTNVVGWSNFFGLANRRHQLFGGVIGLEGVKSRPGALRLEAGVVDAWFTANRQNFNQGNINDAERSQGASVRLVAKDKSERARLDAGFTRSRFVNPEDPLLNQGAANVVATRQTSRNARFIDAGYDLVKGFSFIKPPVAPAAADAAATQNGQPPQAAPEPKKFNLTVNLRHEQVDPLFRSIGASTQADLFRNELEFVGSYADLSFTAAHTRFNDNLAEIQTLLRTNTRRTAFAINTPTQGLFSNHVNTAEPNPLFPRLGYTFERVHASADFIPLGDAFKDPGAIPDLATLNQAVTAEWQFKTVRAGYRLNHSLADNRAVGRERADLQNFVHGMTFGWTPRPTFDLNFEMNFEDANNREEANTNRTLRFAVNTTWQATTRQSIALTFSTLGAGDLRRVNRNRNTEFDLQWNYKLTRESENRFQKAQVNYFLRYSNRFARIQNFLENVNNPTKLQTFNTGLNFIFF
ncbi:MAG: hypothetical protein SF339_28190 [Blastocatellia bacterium]|nr:hypothetical protein [Blastocatellia bacterium]